MKNIPIAVFLLPFVLAAPALAKEVTVPEAINGQNVRYLTWTKTHASGSVTTYTRSVPYRWNKNKPFKTEVPYPYGNSKTCFLNKAKEIIICK